MFRRHIVDLNPLAIIIDSLFTFHYCSCFTAALYSCSNRCHSSPSLRQSRPTKNSIPLITRSRLILLSVSRCSLATKTCIQPIGRNLSADSWIILTISRICSCILRSVTRKAVTRNRPSSTFNLRRKMVRRVVAWLADGFGRRRGWDLPSDLSSVCDVT
jgi:hypothetical protein